MQPMAQCQSRPVDERNAIRYSDRESLEDTMSGEHQMITTAFTLDGYKIVRNLGVVRGITVRSRSIVGNFIAGLETLFGGNITIYTQLCERARSDAFERMVTHAADLG